MGLAPGELILRAKLVQFSATLASLAVPDEQPYLFAFHIFNYVRVFALTSKHDGVEEEEEWRLIYIPERDKGGILKPNKKLLHWSERP
jgi:hypothetical protein